MENTVVAEGQAGGGRTDREFGVGRCKLLCREWIDNKVLLYSMGNYIQYSVINHNEKNRELFKRMPLNLFKRNVSNKERRTTMKEEDELLKNVELSPM